MTEFQQIVAAGAAGLGVMEFWCVTHDDGDLEMTASKDMTVPVKIFCDALGMDWEDAVGQGYSLGKITLTRDQVAGIPNDQAFGCLSHMADNH